MDWIYQNRSLVTKILSHTLALCVGGGIGTGLGILALGKYREHISKQYELVLKALSEIEEIMNDVTLSADEREKKAEETFEFAMTLLNEGLI